MSKEKQIEIKVVTYKEERLNYFTALYEKAKNKFNRLFKKHKDAPYLSDEFQKLSDAGHEAEFLGDVVKMLKQSEWISVDERLPEDTLPTDYKHKTIKVLVAIKAKNGVSIRTQKRFLDYIYEDDERTAFWTWRFSAGDVTHWMPLPEPPKMKGGE